MNIQTLPELCLLYVFDRVRIIDLLQISAVSPHWQQLVRLAFKRRRSLKLILVNYYNVPELKKLFPDTNTLVTGTGKCAAPKLLNLLPNIRSLELITGRLGMFNIMRYVPIPELLLNTCWTERIVRLRLVMFKNDFPIEDQGSDFYRGYFGDESDVRLVQLLNTGLPALRHLTLDDCIPPAHIPALSGVLSQLRSFAFNGKSQTVEKVSIL